MECVPTLLFSLVHITPVSPDTKIFRFAFLDPAMSLNIPTCHHMVVHATIGGKKIKRKYTPISDGDQKGYCDLLIKIYYPCQRFPEGGKMTQYIDGLKLGDTLEFSGPRGKVTYASPGVFTLHKQANLQVTPRHVGLIAGGSGIAPMYQLLRYIQSHHEGLSLSLIYANKTERDILLRNELEDMARTGGLRLWMTVDQPEQGWTGGAGYVTKEMIGGYMPPAAEDVLIFVCGSSPMNKMLKSSLSELGYPLTAKF